MDKAEKLTMSLGILLILFAAINLYLGFNLVSGITGEAISSYNTHTKAICDENNYCEDYEIICVNGNLIIMNPTGFAIQNPDGWKDPRSKEVINKIC